MAKGFHNIDEEFLWKKVYYLSLGNPYVIQEFVAERNKLREIEKNAKEDRTL